MKQKTSKYNYSSRIIMETINFIILDSNYTEYAKELNFTDIPRLIYPYIF